MSKRNDLRNVSISHGTLRTEDLIDAFMPVIERYRYWDYGRISQLLDQYPDEKDDTLNDEIFPMMESLAPEGYYFGAHPGDGSDFGFWQDDDEQ